MRRRFTPEIPKNFASKTRTEQFPRISISMGVEKEPETLAGGTNVSPQRLRDPVGECCRQTSLDLAAQSKTRFIETLCLRWNERYSR
jgi:hypothetical protein